MQILEILGNIFNNSILVATLAAWVTAQVVKVIVHAFTEHEFNWRRVFGAGGMPSSHSAITVSLVVSCGWQCGFDSPAFAIATTLALIVMHDAMGVRRETDKQTSLLKQIANVLDDLSDKNIPQILTVRLKDFVGHTPTQVFAGGFVGFLVALLFILVLRIDYGQAATIFNFNFA